MRRRYAALIASLVLGGCATIKPDLIVLLPDKEGKVGTVVVQGQKGKAVLNTAYAAARTTSDGGVQRGTCEPERGKGRFWQRTRAQPFAFLSPLSFISRAATTNLPRSRNRKVKRLLAEMARRQAPDITVIGHTDLVGPNHPMMRFLFSGPSA